MSADSRNILKIMQHLFIYVILATITRSNTQSDINVINELCKDDGKWILAAASSNALDARPPSRTCISVTVTDTGKTSNCIFNNYDHTVRKVRMLEVVGMDEQNNTEVHTMGPVHQWLDASLVSPGTDTMTFNSMAKSSICWDPVKLKFKPYTFTATIIGPDPNNRTEYISKISEKSFYIYFLGVNCRMLRSEIHSGLLTKRKPKRREVENMIMKLEQMFKKDFPPLQTKCTSDSTPKFIQFQGFMG